MAATVFAAHSWTSVCGRNVLGGRTPSADTTTSCPLCACQLVHVVRVASQNLQQRMLAFDLLRRVHERRYFMPSGKPKVDDFSSGVSVGAR
jgi:hypothetical protein